jgi:hypothetical protein
LFLNKSKAKKNNYLNQILPFFWVHPPILYQSIESAFTDEMHDNVNHAGKKLGGWGEYLFHLAQSDTGITLKSIHILFYP